MPNDNGKHVDSAFAALTPVERARRMGEAHGQTAKDWLNEIRERSYTEWVFTRKPAPFLSESFTPEDFREGCGIGVDDPNFAMVFGEYADAYYREFLND